MTEEYGYGGKILRVDLSSGKITSSPTLGYAEQFLGGRGLGAKIYWDEVAPQVRAFDPDNRLIFSVGPTAGLPVVGGSRWQICGKSPAISPQQFSYCNLGGHWGAHLRLAGYDALVVQGQAGKPVYLSIGDDGVYLGDASWLWGMNAVEVRQKLKEKLGSSAKIVTYGPAGENLVPYATLLADQDASGSTGFGAVMGAKKLKAVTARGTGKAIVADPERFTEFCHSFRELKRGHDSLAGNLELGQLMAWFAPRLKKEACYGCIAACTRKSYEAQDGTKGKFFCGAAGFYVERARRYYDQWTEVPFFATKLCDYYSLNTSVIRSLLTWLSRCYKSRVLTDENTGLPLSKIGSLEFIEALVKKISFREGFGDVLAKGLQGAAATVGQGTEHFITDYTLKADTLAAYCPRMYIVSGLLYALENRMPIQQLHEIGTALFDWLEWTKKLEGAYLSTKVFRKIAARFWGGELAADFSTYEGKAMAAVKVQDRQYAKECLIVCDHMWPVVSVRHSEDHIGDPTVESRLFSAITGREVGEEGLYRVGERVFNLQRAILIREGHRGRQDDTLPEAFFNTPLSAATMNPECLAPGRDGETISRKGAVVEPEKFERMKDEFYQLRGWDVATGLQKRAKLVELGLEDIAADLAQRGLAV
jgi:aldehyde:ferredoxin oxidoreductase